jgi:Pin2-interacting protein X1
MSAQGWTPGNTLGARDAAHADFLTTASSTHIKVSIKDDTLGLGARAGRDPLGEPTGLDAFKGLLGRLNGKSEVVLKQEQRKRDDVKLARYAAMKFPEVRFVSAGLLTQEKPEELPAKDDTPKKSTKSTKQQSDGDAPSDDAKAARKSSKSSKKSRSSRADEPDSSASASESKKEKKKEKKEKKEKKSKKRRAAAEEGDPSSEEDTPQPSVETTVQPSKDSDASSARERRPNGRQFLRGRHIAQKKRALLDDKSLNEVRAVPSFSLPSYTNPQQIFMVKA